MSLGFDLRRELATGVRNADGASQFIQRFAAAYDRPIVASDGWGEEELRTAEHRLGFALPDPLREVHRLIGKRYDLVRVQDVLLTPAQLHVDEAGEVLVIRLENQNVAQWGVPLRALSEPDPPVVFRLTKQPPPEGAWQPFLERVSLACVEMVLSEWMLSGGAFCDDRELDDQAITGLEAQFGRLPMPEYPLWANPQGRPMRWFHGEGTVLREDAGSWLWVRATSREALAAVRQALPGDWTTAYDT